MAAPIIDFTEPHTPTPGAVVGYLVVEPASERGVGAVEVTVRDRAGRVASVVVPADSWAKLLGHAAGQLARSLRADPRAASCLDL